MTAEVAAVAAEVAAAEKRDGWHEWASEELSPGIAQRHGCASERVQVAVWSY